ncbi:MULTISPECIES: hypothetical protein [unclassified Massilia]|uniref:hypothetical protein n=1 Tax=unclassified Massilia TaxID=2609279 RepID=UPI0017844298|nr:MULTISPECIES: hypothetical protein [unclassified Massilia]MBD8528909.1 hypothetical protein [Massilia sp. CFBP 13647]MBD8673551.1 hypothetical protein [Massilia sp. CFBP 13721]
MHTVTRLLDSRIFQWALLLAFLSCYPLSRIMPPSWAWENGVVENAQALALVVGAVLAWLAWRRLRPHAAALIARCAVPVWLLLAGRELSWGAVFLPPHGFDAGGPIYTSRVLWYRPLVPAFAAIVLVIVLIVAWRQRLDRPLRQVMARRRFPWLPILTIVAVMCASTFAEGHLYPFKDVVLEQGEAYEELVELVGYLALLAAQARVLRETTPAGQPGRAGKAGAEEAATPESIR